MTPLRFLIPAIVIFAGAFLVACEGTDAPVTAQLTQEPSPTNTPVTMHLPQVARDGPAGTFHYTVKSGDTVFSLAQTYGTTVARIVELNGLDDAGEIEVGQVLIMPMAAPTATPTATPTTVPSGPSQVIQHGPRNTNYIALTFDMGGRVDPALDIVNYLIDNEIPATLFMTGAIVENQNTDAGRQVLQLIADHPELFDLGNHSYSHPDFTTLSAAQMRSEMSTTEAAIADYITTNPRPLFRPPFGAYNQTVLNVIGPEGYPYTIMWDIDTIDWLPVQDGGPTAGELSSKVVSNAQGGSIVLMHLGGYNTYPALPAMIQGLRNKGLEPVTLATMLGTN